MISGSCSLLPFSSGAQLTGSLLRGLLYPVAYRVLPAWPSLERHPHTSGQSWGIRNKVLFSSAGGVGCNKETVPEFPDLRPARVTDDIPWMA